MADRFTRWLELGDGKMVKATDVVAVSELFEPPEWAKAEEKLAYQLGFRSVAVTQYGLNASRLTPQELSAALKKALAE